MRVEHFKSEHLDQLERQLSKTYENINPDCRKALVANKTTWTIMGNDGRIFMCGGIIKYWENRVEAWAMFDQNMASEFISVHRICKRYLDFLPHKRIECVVQTDFKEGNRWAKALGFELECPRLKCYFNDGKDAVLYSRIKVGV